MDKLFLIRNQDITGANDIAQKGTTLAQKHTRQRNLSDDHVTAQPRWPEGLYICGCSVLIMADEEFRVHYFVFRLVRGTGKGALVYYCLEGRPLDSAGGCVSYSDLPSLAEAFVEHQLDELKRIGLSGDEHFSFSFSFSQPYDVRMQRDSFWHAHPLTGKEQKEFLTQLNTHYMQQCNPKVCESFVSDKCAVF